MHFIDIKLSHWNTPVNTLNSLKTNQRQKKLRTKKTSNVYISNIYILLFAKATSKKCIMDKYNTGEQNFACECVICILRYTTLENRIIIVMIIIITLIIMKEKIYIRIR